MGMSNNSLAANVSPVYRLYSYAVYIYSLLTLIKCYKSHIYDLIVYFKDTGNKTTIKYNTSREIYSLLAMDCLVEDITYETKPTPFSYVLKLYS